VKFLPPQRAALLAASPQRVINIRKFEFELYLSADAIITITENDRIRMLQVAPQLKNSCIFTVGPTAAIHSKVVSLDPSGRSGFLFVGTGQVRD
jgi:hypothetical protein